MFIPAAAKTLHGSCAVKVHHTDTFNKCFYVPAKAQWQFAGNCKPGTALSVKPKQNVEWFHISLGTFLQISGPDARSEHRTCEKAAREAIIHCSPAMVELTGSVNCYRAQGKGLNSARWKAHFLLGRDMEGRSDSWSILKFLLVAEGKKKKNRARWVIHPAI